MLMKNEVQTMHAINSIGFYESRLPGRISSALLEVLELSESGEMLSWNSSF